MTGVWANRVRHPGPAIFVACCLVLAVLLWQGLVVTIVPIGGSTAADSFPSAGLSFDPNAYVARIWPKQVVPTVRKDSVPLSELLAALAKGKSAALKKYGNEVVNSYNLLVRFSGKVEKIDTSSPMGTMTVDVANGDKTVPVQVAIGPVILGTTLRDALKFISFGEFLNQIQYGGVSDALNTMVTTRVLTPQQATKLRGQTARIFGAYTYDGSNARNITVTPVIVTVEKGTQG
ncbi:MAG: DUF2291 family protein [Bradyrhizobium sp.]